MIDRPVIQKAKYEKLPTRETLPTLAPELLCGKPMMEIDGCVDVAA
jgi:hypothetical protein